MKKKKNTKTINNLYFHVIMIIIELNIDMINKIMNIAYQFLLFINKLFLLYFRDIFYCIL